MIGVIFALICAIFIAFSQLSLRKSYKEFPPSVGFFFDSVFGLLIWVPLAVFMGISGHASWVDAFIFATISAVLSEALYFYALSHGEELAVTATVLATYPVYTIVFSRLINHEILSIPVMFFVLLTIIGSVIASSPNKLKWSELRNKGIMWPFVAAICVGLSDTISKGYINRSNDFSFLFALGFIQIPVALVYLKMEKQDFTKSIRSIVSKFSNYRFAFLGGLFNIIGTGFLWLSFFYAPASIASPITGTNGALTVLLSRILLKEKTIPRKYFGIILAFIGILGISILKAD